MSADSQLPPRAHPSSWTRAAGWSAAIATVWVLIMAVWVWLDNHGEPWIWWALGVETGAPVLLLVSSLLAWRCHGGLRWLGWGMLIFCLCLMLLHLCKIAGLIG